MILIISENYLWKAKNMTKQTKIIISVVLSCTMLLLLFIPSFALEGSYQPYLYCGNDTLSYVNTNGVDVVVTAPGTYSVSVEGETVATPFTSFKVFSDDNEFALSIYSPAAADGSYVWVPIYYAIGEPPFDNGQWSYSGFTCLDISSPFTISDPSVAEWFDSNFTQPPIYDGNPFSDIMDMVIEALDVPLFGSFSLWDMLTTVCGLFAVVWLLKLLAGG